MSYYRKKPVVIEAFQWIGDQDQTEDPEWIVEALKNRSVFFENDGLPIVQMIIPTLEGRMRANPGDWIIRGVAGELYPCKLDIFEKTYEKVE